MIRYLLIQSLLLSASAADITWLDDAMVQKAKQAVVAVSVRENFGNTGFFASDDGLVVTNASQFEGASKVRIFNSAGKEIPGCLLMMINPATDIAVLATGKKAPAYLAVDSRPAHAGESCAVIFGAGVAGKFITVDGKLLALRAGLDWTETRFIDLWSVGLNPNMHGLTGAPVITQEGRVAGMCDFVTGVPPQRFVFAIPETAIASALAQAREAQRPIKFPREGEISVYGVPSDPDYLSAMKLMSAGNFAAALEKFESALQSNPQNPLTMIQVASCRANIGDLTGARKILEDAIRVAPERLKVRLFLGRIIASQSESASSLAYFQELADHFPQSGDVWGTFGEYLIKAGRGKEAVEPMKKWTELEPDSMRAWEGYAQALAASGDPDGAHQARAHFDELESALFKIRYSTPERK